MKGICLGEKANQKSSREPAIGRAGASVFASFKPENEKPSSQDLMRSARFSHHFAEIDILPRPVVQPKLVVGPPGDKYEQEADRVACRVVGTISSSDQFAVQRKEGVKELGKPQWKVAGILPSGSVNVEPDLESVIRQAQGGGNILSDDIRQPMEYAFGVGFGGVKVHTDSQADSLNRSLQARAFTLGQDIFLRQGEYQPGSSEGQRLLAHELTHVVQQSRNPSNSNGWHIQLHPDLRVGHRSRTLRIRWHGDYDVFRERVRNLVISQLDVPSTWSYQLLHVRHVGDLRSTYNELDRENPLRSNGTVVIIRAEYNALRDVGASSIEFAVVSAPSERTRIHEPATFSTEVLPPPNLPVGERAGLETEPRSRA